ncbi:MAG: carbohydrate porin [Akkermansiaceae bacterium]|nr:carbohydrate porin [Akkermansiaceae bacterium]
MKTNTMTRLGLAVLMATPAAAEEANLLKDINQFGAEWGDDTALVSEDSLTKAITKAHADAYEKYGLEWVVETSYLFSAINNPNEGMPGNQNWYLLHAQANWNINKSTNTWIRAEISLSAALDSRTWRGDGLNEAVASTGALNADVFTRRGFGIPELAVMQYLNNETVCIIAGIINQTNYFDANAYANSTFTNFTNSVFVNTPVLPLADSNFGFVAQSQFNEKWYGMLSYSITESEMGYTPWHRAADRDPAAGVGYNLLAEVGYVHEKGAIRITPFVAQNFDGEKDRTYGGVSVGFDQELTGHLACFGRVGISSSDDNNFGGASFAASAGLILKQPLTLLFGHKESENNFLGVALSVVRPNTEAAPEDEEEEAVNGAHAKRELVLEVGYSYAVTPFFCVRPNWQLIQNPSGSARSTATAFGVQAVLTF